MKTRYLISPVFFAITITVFFVTDGCKKFVEIQPGPNLIVSAKIFSDSTDANSAVLGMYLNMSQTGGNNLGIYNGLETVYNGSSADELQPLSDATDKVFYANALLATGSGFNFFWQYYYQNIYCANAVIEGLASSKTISQSVHNQFTGEAKVVRAFTYFHLVNMFGGVPLVTSTDYHVNATLPRATTIAVYQQMEADLVSAESLLTPAYLTNGRARANSYTAAALLARVYLYEGKWANAETEASKVIAQSGTYSLVPLNNVFLSTNVTPSNTEAIWQLIPESSGSGYETAEGQVFIPASNTVVPKYVVSKFLLHVFEPNDQRKLNWLDSSIVKGNVYYYPYKYKLRKDGNTQPLENYMVLRLSEQYLIRAEAETYGAGKGLSGAINDLNAIRTRAGLPNYAGAVQADSVRSAIYHERQVELFCEWGLRWYDLKRTGQIDAVMGAPGNVCQAKGGTWSSYKALYPIPQREINSNPFLTQNAGY